MVACILVSAEWCGACQPMKEYWKTMSYPGVRFQNRDIDAIVGNVYGYGVNRWMSLGANLLFEVDSSRRICSLPTIVIMDSTGVLAQESGAKTERGVISMLDSVIGG